MDTILTVSQLKKVYGGRGSRTTALDGLSFSVSAGEFTGIMGASGSGKTTLLNCISTNLLDTLTAFENIALALTILGAPAGEVEQRVRASAALLGLEKVLDKYPYQMSGGEQQRVAAARAIVGRPALVLADEPTGALDSKAAGQLLRQLDQLNREQGATILMVTHDAFTASWCRRILFIQDGVLFRELRRGDQDRRTFFAQILGVVGALGGDAADVW